MLKWNRDVGYFFSNAFQHLANRVWNNLTQVSKTTRVHCGSLPSDHRPPTSATYRKRCCRRTSVKFCERWRETMTWTHAFWKESRQRTTSPELRLRNHGRTMDYPQWGSSDGLPINDCESAKKPFWVEIVDPWRRHADTGCENDLKIREKTHSRCIQ